MKLRNNKSMLYPLGVGILMALYTVILGATCHIKYHHFGYDDFDVAIHTQSLAAILRGSSESSILGIPFLGNHMVLILYAIAPLYAIFPSALLLLYIQTIVLAAGAWAIFRLAQRELSPGWGLALAAAYSVYPPLIHLNLYEFHPIALASTFILYALLFWKRNAFVPFLVMLLLAASCQENISLMAIGFSVFAISIGSEWVPVSGKAAWQLSGATLFIVGGYLFSVMTMRVGAIDFVAPFRYTSLLCALILGLFVFGEWPDKLTLIGSAIVVATGAFTLYRERRIVQAREPVLLRTSK